MLVASRQRSENAKCSESGTDEQGYVEATDERILQSTNTRERKMAVAWLRNSRSALVPNFLAVAREGNPHKLDVTNWTGTFVIVEQIPQLGSIEERV